MELLSRDIKTIIHRYIFDYYYCGVKDEYKYKWLSGDSYWDDDDQCFVDDDNYTANWRYFNNGVCQGLTIYKFGASYHIATLSKNY